jgi:hypothetical protein
MRAILSFVMVLGLSAGVFAQQSLGDIARQNRAKKRGTSNVKLDDDNMPRRHSTPDASQDKKDEDKTADAAKSKDEKDEKDAKDATKKENADVDSKKPVDFKGKIDEQ